MQISVHGTAFTFYDVKANKQTKEEINQEKVSFDETIKQTNAVENVVYHTTTQADDAKPTTFVDPVTKKYVIASLENKTLDKLRANFRTDDVIEKEDGTIRLTGEAEAFVSGWFADIAYKREFLTADANSDGQLSEEEYRKVKNSYNSEGYLHVLVDGTTEKIAYFGEKITEQYVTFDKNNITYRSHQNSKGLASSLDDELNMTLNLDKNFDGVMTLKESYKESEEPLLDTVMADLKSIGETGEPLNDSEIDEITQFLTNIYDEFVQGDYEGKSIFEQIFNLMLEAILKNIEKKLDDTMKEMMSDTMKEIMLQVKSPAKNELDELHKKEQLNYVIKSNRNNNLQEMIKISEVRDDGKVEVYS